MKRVRLSNLKRLARISEEFDVASFQPDVPGQQFLPGLEEREIDMKALAILKQLSELEEQFWEVFDDNEIYRNIDGIEIPESWIESRIDDEVSEYAGAVSDYGANKEFMLKVVDSMDNMEQSQKMGEFLDSMEFEELLEMDFDYALDLAVNIIRDDKTVSSYFVDFFDKVADEEEKKDIMEDAYTISPILDRKRRLEELQERRIRLDRSERYRIDREKEEWEEGRREKPIGMVEQKLDDKQKKLLQNLVSRLQRGHAKKQELEHFFKKFKWTKPPLPKIEEEEEEVFVEREFVPTPKSEEEIDLEGKLARGPSEEEKPKDFLEWFNLLSKRDRHKIAHEVIYNYGDEKTESTEMLTKIFYDVSLSDGAEDVPESGSLKELFDEWVVENISDDEVDEYVKYHYIDEIRDYLYDSETSYVREEQPDQIGELSNENEIGIADLIELNDFFKDDSRAEAYESRQEWMDEVSSIVDKMDVLLRNAQADSDVDKLLSEYIEKAAP